ncbi:MAG: TrkA C-terminal domain-containing protein [Acidimicrobiales bacterium]
MEASGAAAAPFIDSEGRYVGVVTLEALRRRSKDADVPRVGSLIDVSFAPIHQAVHLDVVLDTLTSTPQTWAAVVDDERRVIGTIATSDIVRSYRRTLQASLRRVSELGGPSGISEVVVAENSAIVGASLRSARMPRGVLVTSIERGREVVPPTGDTLIHAGDRIMVLGAPDDLNRLSQLASGKT